MRVCFTKIYHVIYTNTVISNLKKIFLHDFHLFCRYCSHAHQFKLFQKSHNIHIII